MSATGELVLAIQEEEARIGHLNDEQLMGFIRAYSKDKLPAPPLDEERARHAHNIDQFNQLLTEQHSTSRK